MTDNRTMVDRPKRRPFLGVSYGLRAGVHSVVAGRPLPAARRRSSCARAEVVYAGRYSRGGRQVVRANYQVSKAFTATRVGQTLAGPGPDCAQIDDSAPPPRSPDTTRPCAPEGILTWVQQCAGVSTVLVKRQPSLGTSCMGGLKIVTS
jgi:hypothetical protein